MPTYNTKMRSLILERDAMISEMFISKGMTQKELADSCGVTYEVIRAAVCRYFKTVSKVGPTKYNYCDF